MPSYIPEVQYSWIPLTPVHPTYQKTYIRKERINKVSVTTTVWLQYLFLFDSKHSMLMKTVTGKSMNTVGVLAGSRLCMKTEKKGHNTTDYKFFVSKYVLDQRLMWQHGPNKNIIVLHFYFQLKPSSPLKSLSIIWQDSPHCSIIIKSFKFFSHWLQCTMQKLHKTVQLSWYNCATLSSSEWVMRWWHLLRKGLAPYTGTPAAMHYSAYVPVLLLRLGGLHF